MGNIYDKRRAEAIRGSGAFADAKNWGKRYPGWELCFA